MDAMDDISCYKNISDDYYFLSPKEGDYVPGTRLGNPLIRKALDTRDLTG